MSHCAYAHISPVRELLKASTVERAADICAIRVYVAPVAFDKNDKPSEEGTSKRSFCSECSSMLWNYHDEWPDVRLLPFVAPEHRTVGLDLCSSIPDTLSLHVYDRIAESR